MGAPKSRKLIRFHHDRDIQRQFINHDEVLTYITDQEDYTRVFLAAQELETLYVNKVAHGLGRKPIKWRINAADTCLFYPYEVQDPDENYIYLAVTADCILDIEVW